MKIKKVLIAGAGTMGSGIAQCIAEHNIFVFLYDSDTEVIKMAISKISERLQKAIDKGELEPSQKDEILSRIQSVSSIEQAKDAEFIIEAIIEKMESKKKLFQLFDRMFSEDIVLASNTSSLSINEIAESTIYPERVIGMHFFNPAYKMKLVEIVKGEKTSENTITTAKLLAEHIGKIVVEVNDKPGFIVNRLLIPMINEAAKLLQEKVADRESIDTAMKIGASHPMGPLALADLIGIDVCVKILENLEKKLKSPQYAPCELLKQMVNENKLGRKTGSGFYNYEKK